MPLARIDVNQSASAELIRAVSDAIYEAMREFANVPVNDKFQVVTRHAADEIIYPKDGYLGIDSTRGEDGVGITISWWRDEAAALAWRDDPDHARIRDRGRAQWYDWYRVIVATVDRAYEWARSTG